MEIGFEGQVGPTCLAAHPNIENRLAIGFIDGNIALYDFDSTMRRMKVSCFLLPLHETLVLGPLVSKILK